MAKQVTRHGARSFDYWFTTAEWGSDRRTGAVAVIRERQRRAGDRPGKNADVWDWQVSRGADFASGTSQTQGGARRKCRDVVAGLSAREAEEP